MRKPKDMRSRTKSSIDKKLVDNNGKTPSNKSRTQKRNFSTGRKTEAETKTEFKNPEAEIRLNKYISNSGLCSRREADELIKQGKISVNGKIISELGTKVFPKDKISFNEKELNIEQHVYFLLNKPKDYITTTKDPQKRKTVMQLMANVTKERIYPVGRLDKMTTGLLLFTNDGETAKKLTHPSSEIQKMYVVETDKNVKQSDVNLIRNGLELEDGIAMIDSLNYDGDKSNKSRLVITLHSGKNRIIRRIFEHLNYTVVKLDRVYFAGLTKKDLPRGRSRELTKMEVNMLHMIKNKKGPA